MIVFDVTKKTTFENARSWIKELNENASLDILIALVGNKADLTDQRELSFEVLYFYKQMKYIYYFLFFEIF